VPLNLSPSRRAAQARLHEFVPHAGGTYASRRNFDLGPPHSEQVSRLSPYLQRRMLLETEVVDAVLAQHTPAQAEKFLQEVLWRTYWKGWLEMHPGVWLAYTQALAAPPKSGLVKPLAQAMGGATGIACFDAWVQELRDTGYLHNHARMWFASIWIFTLRLPWEQGAQFFLSQLLDGDPASNTLGWRWVAGLQTRGKIYLASSQNIAQFTQQRFAATPNLATQAALSPADAQAASPVRLPAELPSLPEAPPAGRLGLLVHGEDLCLEHSEVAAWPMAAVATLGPQWIADATNLSALPLNFSEAAMQEAAARLQSFFNVASTALAPPALPRPTPAALVAAVQAWMQAAQLQAVVVVLPHVGPWGDLLAALLQLPQVITFRRRHDRLLYPGADRGFFHFRKQLPTYFAGRLSEQ
jgi:deoxyribodipyrimidine photo-lyase